MGGGGGEQAGRGKQRQVSEAQASTRAVAGGTHLGDLREAATVRHLEERRLVSAIAPTEAIPPLRTGSKWAPPCPPPCLLPVLLRGWHSTGGKRPASPSKAAFTSIGLALPF